MIKQRRPIRKVSLRRQRENVEYRKLKREWKFLLQELGRWRCVCCKGTPDDSPHHKFGRGPNFLNMNTWVPLCRFDHAWVHDNQDKARALGLLAPKGQWLVRQP